METLDELRARIALKRSKRAGIEQTAPDEPYLPLNARYAMKSTANCLLRGIAMIASRKL
jgi:hypothetical protein